MLIQSNCIKSRSSWEKHYLFFIYQYWLLPSNALLSKSSQINCIIICPNALLVLTSNWLAFRSGTYFYFLFLFWKLEQYLSFSNPLALHLSSMISQRSWKRALMWLSQTLSLHCLSWGQSALLRKEVNALDLEGCKSYLKTFNLITLKVSLLPIAEERTNLDKTLSCPWLQILLNYCNNIWKRKIV